MNKLIEWLVNRQTSIETDKTIMLGGIQGRVNKNTDTCYTYWIGSFLF